MTALRRFWFFKQISRHIAFKLLAAIALIALIFIPVASFVSYQLAYDEAQESAQLRVNRMVKLINYNAAMAAYLSDKELAAEIVSGLISAPELIGIRFILSSQEKLAEGKIKQSSPDIVIPLHTPFQSNSVGELALFLDWELINTQARSKGLSLMTWQLSLLATLLGCIFFIIRIVVARPLKQLITQVNNVEINDSRYARLMSIHSDDEIGFLAKNTNQMLEKIRKFYLTEKEKNARIARLEQQFRMIFENSHAGIALIDLHNSVVLANQAFQQMYHAVPESDKQQIYLPDLFEQSDEVLQLLGQVRQQDTSLFRDFQLKNQPDVWIRVLFSLVTDTNQSQMKQFVELVVYDISDRAKQEKLFAYNASHDALTGLVNRRGGEISFNKQLQKSKQQQAEMVFIWLDLNDFKPINDIYGHDAGDIVLKELSSRLLSISRPDDTVARWGGDEFIITMCLDNLQRLPAILADLQNVFSAEIEISADLSVKVGASIGVSTSSNTGYDIEALLERADQLMYEVKRNGKTGVIIDTDKRMLEEIQV